MCFWGTCQSGEVERVIAEVFRDDALREGLALRSVRAEDVWQAVVAYVMRAFQALAKFFEDLHLHAPILWWLTLGLLLILLVALLLHIGLSLAKGLQGSFARVQPESGPSAKIRRFGDLRGAAREAAGRGEYRAAVRGLAIALLALLEERRSLHVRRGWTTREVLDRLRDKSGPNAYLKDFGVGVERISYGKAQPCAEDFGQLDALLDPVIESLARG